MSGEKLDLGKSPRVELMAGFLIIRKSVAQLPCGARPWYTRMVTGGTMGEDAA